MRVRHVPNLTRHKNDVWTLRAYVVGEKTLRPLRYWACRSLGASHWLAIKGLGLRWTLVVFFLALFGLYFHIQRLIESFLVVQKKKVGEKTRILF